MAIKWQPGCLAKRFDDRGPDGQIGDKMTVHDVDMDDSGAASRGLLDLVRQMGEVGGEYRGCKFDQNRVPQNREIIVEILARQGPAAGSDSSLIPKKMRQFKRDA